MKLNLDVSLLSTSLKNNQEKVVNVNCPKSECQLRVACVLCDKILCYKINPSIDCRHNYGEITNRGIGGRFLFDQRDYCPNCFSESKLLSTVVCFSSDESFKDFDMRKK